MNTSSLTRKFFPALLILFFLCRTASASEDIWTFGVFGKFGPSASTSQFSGPDAQFTMRFIASEKMNHFSPQGDKLSMSLIGVELNLGGKLSGFVAETALLGARSLELSVDEGRVKIEFYFSTSLYTGPVTAPNLVASQQDVRGVITIGARTAPFAGKLYVEMLPRLTPGSFYSFTWLSQPGPYVGHRNGLGEETIIASDQNRQDATFRVARGLAARNCFSFESVNNPGKFLRHKDGRIRLDADDGGQFAGDATFCETFPLGGLLGISKGGFSLASYNLPGYYIVRAGGQLLLQVRQVNTTYESAASYEIAAPLWHQMSQPARPSIATRPAPTVTPAQPADTGEIDVDSYYRLTNAELGDTRSLEAKLHSQYSKDYSVLMGQTSDNNPNQHWIFVRKGNGYQLVNAVIGDAQVLVVGPKAQDTEDARYPENPIHMRKGTGLTFEVKALGDGYFALNVGSYPLGVIRSGHGYYLRGTPALVPRASYGYKPSSTKWKITRLGSIR